MSTKTTTTETTDLSILNALNTSAAKLSEKEIKAARKAAKAAEKATKAVEAAAAEAAAKVSFSIAIIQEDKKSPTVFNNVLEHTISGKKTAFNENAAMATKNAVCNYLYRLFVIQQKGACKMGMNFSKPFNFEITIGDKTINTLDFSTRLKFPLKVGYKYKARRKFESRFLIILETLFSGDELATAESLEAVNAQLLAIEEANAAEAAAAKAALLKANPNHEREAREKYEARILEEAETLLNPAKIEETKNMEIARQKLTQAKAIVKAAKAARRANAEKEAEAAKKLIEARIARFYPN